MARSDKRYSVYPAPKAVQIFGDTSPALNQAIECWAALLARATADNYRQFSQADHVDMHFEGKLWAMNEWSLLAEALKGLHFDPEFAHPGLLVAAAVEDAHRLEFMGHKCINPGECDGTVLKPEHVDAEVQKTVEKLRSLDYVHAWAVIVAVRWFWEHQDEGIDIQKDDWCLPAFRRQWHQKHSGKEQAAAARARKGRGRKSTKRE
jgi:hypothetical protein